MPLVVSGVYSAAPKIRWVQVTGTWSYSKCAVRVSGVVLLWLVYLLPSLYAWLWLPQAQATGPLARAGLLVLGFAGPLILLLSFSTRLALGIETPWYLLSLVSVGYVPWIAVGLAFAWLAIAAQLTALAVGRYAPFEPPGVV